MSKRHREAAFETVSEAQLLANGYVAVYESTEIICPEADTSIDRLTMQNFKKFTKQTFLLYRLRERGGKMQC